ncbi:MAG: VCBS repeat-containing protein [Planctomycetes bacterium]|nr:VCBS repeat-containing protein [Planctomycetota bacterium]
MRSPFPLLLVAACAAPWLSAQTSFSATLYPSCPVPSAVAAGDLDSDGDTDLATAHAGADQVCCQVNTGAAVFANLPLLAYPAGSAPVELAVADLDGSGRRDLAVVLQVPALVSIHLAAGAFPLFGPPQLVPVGPTPLEVVAFDYDSDGDRDLAVLCQNPSAVYVLGNNGAGVFAVTGVFGLPIAPHAIAAGDLNADGRADLAVTGSAGTAFVAVLLNTTTGLVPTFAPPLLFGVDFRPFGVCIADLNDDGYNDVATSNAAFSTVDVLINNPPSITPTSIVLTTTLYPLAPGLIVGPATEIDAHDLDCDGDVDLAVSCNGSSHVAFFWNQGPGTGVFIGPALTPLPGGPGDLVIADLDGSGQRDVATANGAGNVVGILVNNFGPTCCQHRFIAGISDGFNLATPPIGPEDSCPAADLLAWFGPGARRHFDGPVGCGRPLLHTFGGIPAGVKTARLTMRLRADCATSPDDRISLGFDAVNGQMVWTRRIATLTGTPWTAGSFGGFSLDLGALPGGTSLLAKMSATGRLDVVLGDDTAVDSMILEYETCARSPGGMFLNVSPLMMGSLVTWTASGAPLPPGGIVFLFGPGVGVGPVVPGGQLCLLAPSFLAIVPTSAAGGGGFALALPPVPVLPCVSLSFQAVGWDSTATVWAHSNTVTQYLFD